MVNVKLYTRPAGDLRNPSTSVAVRNFEKGKKVVMKSST
jgi:hypothetical protein